MAIIKIQNAVIERVFSGGKGFAVAETYQTRDGEQGKKPFTLWFDEPQSLSVGDKGNFSGLYSDKIESFTGREGNEVQTIRRNLNSARLDGDLVPAAAEQDDFAIADSPF